MQDKSQIAQQLIIQYNQGTLSEKDEALLEAYIADGIVEIAQLEDLHELDQQLDTFFEDHLTTSMEQRFDQWLGSLETGQAPNRYLEVIKDWWSTIWQLTPQYTLAYSLLLFLIGGWISLQVFSNAENGIHSVDKLTAEVKEVKDQQEELILALFEKESASDRLRVVNQTKSMDEVGEKLINALLHTLNFDENVNVRLVALETLVKYAGNPYVRENLIKSISYQDSPLVQLAMAQVMVELQEKKSKIYFDQILNNEKTPPEVKSSIEQKLEILL